MDKRVKLGPAPGLTRDVFLEQLASGETQSSIAKTWNVNGHTLKYWIEKWDLKGVNAEKARVMLAPQAEAPLLRSTSPEAQAIEAKAIGLPAINEEMLETRIKELSTTLQERNAEIGGLRTALDKSIADEAEARRQLLEITEDRDNWSQEYAVLEERYGDLKTDLLNWKSTAEQFKQAVAELEEERAVLLQTIEQAAEDQNSRTKRDPNSTYQALVEIGVLKAPAETDNVHSPAHYTQGGIETIDFIRAKLTPEEFAGYCKGNALKYVSRATYKGGAEDLRKAGVYLGWAIGGGRG